jgi:hypothetical protein
MNNSCEFFADETFKNQDYKLKQNIDNEVAAITSAMYREVESLDTGRFSSKDREEAKTAVFAKATQKIALVIGDMAAVTGVEYRCKQYEARQKETFAVWIVEATAWVLPSIEGRDTKCKPELFSHVTDYIVNYNPDQNRYGRMSNVIDLIQHGRLGKRCKLAAYKEYLKTPEAQLIISGQKRLVTPETYTIYSVDELKALSKQSRFIIQECAEISEPAKKQKMSKEDDE